MNNNTENNSNNTEILLIGYTGNGKSSLGNFLLGQKVFKVSANPNSETDITEKRTVDNLTIIDTPGFSDSNGKDKDNEHMSFMIKYIKQLQYLNGILIVISCYTIRSSTDFKNMIKQICNIFHFETFQNIGIVFSNYCGKPKKKEELKKNKIEFVEELKKVIEKFYRKKLEHSLQYFFIDSDLDDIDEESNEERYKIIMWMNGLTYINSFQVSEVKDINHKSEKWVYYSEQREYVKDDYQIKEITKKRKLIAIDLDDNEIDMNKIEDCGTSVVKIPIKKSLWQKILGGILIVGGILAAPFSAGATLTGVTGGSALIISSEI